MSFESKISDLVSNLKSLVEIQKPMQNSVAVGRHLKPKHSFLAFSAKHFLRFLSTETTFISWFQKNFCLQRQAFVIYFRHTNRRLVLPGEGGPKWKIFSTFHFCHYFLKLPCLFIFQGSITKKLFKLSYANIQIRSHTFYF